MRGIIITKLNKTDNFGDDFIAVIEKRITRLTNQRDARPTSCHDYYNARIEANQKKIERLRCTQQIWNIEGNTDMSNNIIYDETQLYRAVKTDEPASWIEQDELCWQAQYYDENSINEDHWERGSYYETPELAISAAKEAKHTANFFKNLF